MPTLSVLLSASGAVLSLYETDGSLSVVRVFSDQVAVIGVRDLAVWVRSLGVSYSVAGRNVSGEEVTE